MSYQLFHRPLRIGDIITSHKNGVFQARWRITRLPRYSGSGAAVYEDGPNTATGVEYEVSWPWQARREGDSDVELLDDFDQWVLEVRADATSR
jgi:hypothetical protein